MPASPSSSGRGPRANELLWMSPPPEGRGTLEEWYRPRHSSRMQARLFSVREAASILKLSERRVRYLCAEGRLGSKVGSSYVIQMEELESFSSLLRKPGRPRGGIGEDRLSDAV